MSKYYWLKLQKDFFKRHDIRIIESMTNGKDYILFYLKLLVESVTHEGELRFSETIPYNEEMLATITNTNVDIVRSAMDVFKNLNMIDVLEDSTIFMNEVEKMIGAETDEHIREQGRIRQQRYRENQKALRNVTVTLQRNVEKEIEKEKDIDIDKELDIDIKEKRKRFIAPTLAEIQDYIFEKEYNVNAEEFFYYYESNGWKVGKNKMVSWQSTLAQWNARRKAERPKEQSIAEKWLNA